MSFLNRAEKSIHCKIVYYGPGLGGKTTNIEHIYKKTTVHSKSELITLNTDNERTIFFDFLPLDLGEIRGYKTRFHLYTVPGQVFYESSRRLILRGVDGIVFVADSQKVRMKENQESLLDLKKNLKNHGYNLQKIPLVMQWNKRDLADITPIEELEESLNEFNLPSLEAVATDGKGVFDTLKMISKLVIINLRNYSSTQGQETHP